MDNNEQWHFSELSHLHSKDFSLNMLGMEGRKNNKLYKVHGVIEDREYGQSLFLTTLMSACLDVNIVSTS